jgi:hypothetical protein
VARRAQELDSPTLQIFDPLKAEDTGMVSAFDIKLIGEKLENNTTAAILLFENLWAVKLKEDIMKANGRLVMHERIPHKVVLEALSGSSEAE